jgi:hypothetical protein
LSSSFFNHHIIIRFADGSLKSTIQQAAQTAAAAKIHPDVSPTPNNVHHL